MGGGSPTSMPDSTAEPIVTANRQENSSQDARSAGGHTLDGLSTGGGASPSIALWFAQCGVLLALLAAFSFVTAPIPAVNEPHYLGKAKHFWDPNWCPRDFFLDSLDVHAVFYAAIGGLTRIGSLEMTAVVGRLLALGWLASSLLHLVETLGGVATPRHSTTARNTIRSEGDVTAAVGGRYVFAMSRSFPVAVLTVALFLGLSTAGSLSGEWLVGGVEAKVFSYGCLWHAVACATTQRVIAAAALAGCAVSWHPLVGGWGLLALVGSGAWSLARPGERGQGDKASVESPLPIRPWRFVVAAGLFVLAALPGLIPALGALALGDAAGRAEATRIQVFVRLGHHLDPRTFPISAYTWYGLLTAAFFVGGWTRTEARTTRSRLNFWNGFVACAGLFALAGLLVGWGPRTAGLLKFYFFRLYDVALPLAVAHQWALVLGETLEKRDWRRGAWGTALGIATVLTALAIGAALFWKQQRPTPTGEEIRDFHTACRWIREHTPADALVLTPRNNATFRWQAQRSQYVSNKDVPQDAPSVLEWHRRLAYVKAFRDTLGDDGWTPAALARLHRETTINYVLAWRSDAHTSRPVFENGSFIVLATHPALVE